MKWPPKECSGPFTLGSTRTWQKNDFFRPYDKDRGGVSPERWHVSYRPVATKYLIGLTPDVVKAALEEAEIELKDVVLKQLSEIFAKYIRNIAP